MDGEHIPDSLTFISLTCSLIYTIIDFASQAVSQKISGIVTASLIMACVFQLIPIKMSKKGKKKKDINLKWGPYCSMCKLSLHGEHILESITPKNEIVDKK